MKNSSIALERFSGNPILRPESGHPWESDQTFNPGVILLENTIHIIYRAIGDDGISRFGYASTEDGHTIKERMPDPVYQHPFTSFGFSLPGYASGGNCSGAEDPRLVRVDDEDVLYMTYTAFDSEIRLAVTSISVEDFLKKKWHWSPPVLLSPPGQIHKNWVVFPEKINGKYAILHRLNPRVMISYHDRLDTDSGDYLNSYDIHFAIKRDATWDTLVRGAGAPPVRTERGWLLFYHANSRDNYAQYKVGAMLLDLKDPSIILARSPRPVLEPSAVYENYGFKPGIVYLTGVVVRDGHLSAYYGASDSCVCLAECRLDDLLDSLEKEKENRIEKKIPRKPAAGIIRRGGKYVSHPIRRQPRTDPEK